MLQKISADRVRGDLKVAVSWAPPLSGGSLVWTLLSSGAHVVGEWHVFAAPLVTHLGVNLDREDVVHVPRHVGVEATIQTVRNWCGWSGYQLKLSENSLKVDNVNRRCPTTYSY
jgi:hypothetical protein